ncbi:type I-U CRISPR-associated helicase/endonuclease Cas3 [Bifidobacterium sp. ESL0763]|uniref:type I-G CRISPR-associated helicase/endonuclease Cas3g n=1 Tax=Bifidobacterium sp. ESL0763 TaxID=2983227 RepID=UPI0023F82365|nr:type I-U CRISPR-associated helicase/endonuclease Cas3 [Bifidobacterium sp. ESL0763]MDF7663611.1 type I-U CRISPR-associated helicase/endonuclease Cas3 [Bifidobacterium sp. ESL0763]
MDSKLQNYVDTRFDRFVAAIHGGRHPYQWQRRLMHYVIDHGHWPDEIAAPTGAGKTMVMDIHVFLNALAGLVKPDNSEDGNANLDPELQQLTEMGIAHIPRRLVMTVNRRSLVDDQYDEAMDLASRIESAEAQSEGSILSEIRDGLIRRAGTVRDINGKPQCIEDCSPCRVTRLRGGEATDNAKNQWRYYPTQCQIFCATPDMFGSRLLFRGYGITKAARPMEAGLFAYDTVLILDEAHLARQLAQTATDVSRLEGLQKSEVAKFASPLQVVRTTATPADTGEIESVGVEAEDFQKDTDLCSRLTRPKPVALDEVECSDKEYAEHIAQRCMEQLSNIQEGYRGVVGCIVNKVDTAGRVAHALTEALGKTDQYDGNSSKNAVCCFVGPMRPYDKNQLKSVFSEICGKTERNSGLRFVIGTQTLEVGIDADFSALVTELAPVNSLVQRAGRVNRRGSRDNGPITVVIRKNEKKQGAYHQKDLELSLAWLQFEHGANRDLSAWNCVKHPVSPPELDRMALQRLEIWDAENLSCTDEQLAADHASYGRSPADINLWLRDELASDDGPGVGVVVRDLPADGADAAQLVSSAPPVAEESFPMRNYAQFDDIEKAYEKNQEEIRKAFKKGQKKKEPFGPLVIYRPSADDKGIPWDRKTDLKTLVQSGDTLVVSTSASLFDSGTHVLSCSGGKANQAEDDVYNKCQDSGWVLEARKSGDEDGRYRILDDLDGKYAANGQDTETGDDHLVMPTLRQIADEIGHKFAEDVFGDSYDPETRVNVYPAIKVDAERENQSDRIWISVQPLKNLDEDELQEIRVDGSNRIVYLNTPDGHQPCVARRASDLATILGFDGQVCDELANAGLHHDDGKKDWRFQKLLRYRLSKSETDDDSTYLAKSRFYSVSWEKRMRNQLSLAGWRHEQRSAAEYWADPDQKDGEYDTDLITRLIGTSHGHGRSAFRASAATAIPESVAGKDMRRNSDLAMEPAIASARNLFDTGLWQTIVHRTDWKYGFWGVSYLEAILRAADITVSKEG